MELRDVLIDLEVDVSITTPTQAGASNERR